MRPEPREALIKTVGIYGPSLLASPARLDGILKDLGGDHRWEISLLVGCLREGLVERLSQAGVDSISVTCGTLAGELEKKRAVSAEAARWALESWALALGLLNPLATTPSADEPEASLAGPVRESSPAYGEMAKIGTDGSSSPLEIPSPPRDEPADENQAAEAESPHYLAHEPAWKTPPPDWSQPGHTLTVYPEGSSEKPSLHEALREAQPGTRLILKPGVYREPVVVRKDLRLQGEGAPAEIILECAGSSAIRLEAGALFVSGISIKGLGGFGRKSAAVQVHGGHLTLEDCDLTDDAASILEASGADAALVLRRCHLHDAQGNGLILENGARGYLQDSHFYRSKLTNIFIGNGCAPTISACKISHALGSGIDLTDGGAGLIENCDIWKNFSAALQCRNGANPRVRYCRISGSERHGVLLTHKSDGLFEHCLIFENNKAGVTLGQQSRGHFSECRISNNHAEGIDLHAQSEGEFVDCDILNNEGTNVLVREKIQPPLYPLLGARWPGRRRLGNDRFPRTF